MSNFRSEGVNQQSNMQSDDDSEYDDDSISFQYESQNIVLHYLQFSKYSIFIRKKYLITNISSLFPSELQKFQQQSSIDIDSIYLFFRLLQQNFNNDLILTYKQYIDLFKISDFLQIKKLTKKLNNFFNRNNENIDFIIQIIQYETSILNDSEKKEYKIAQNMENILSSKINECLQNDKFSSLDISIINRIVDLSDKSKISSNLLYEFIKKSIEKFCILFAFIDIKKLDDEKLLDMNHAFLNESTKTFFMFLPCNVEYITELKISKKELQNKIDEYEGEKVQIRNQLNSLSIEKTQLQGRLEEVEAQKETLQTRLTKTESERNQLQTRLTNTESERNQLQARLTDVESRLESIYHIKGRIEVSVKHDLVFSAVIRLEANNAALDTTKSKYIVSTSNAQSLGSDAYMCGEPISTFEQTTIDFACKAGTYYVRAFVASIDGKSTEIVSNAVTLNDTRIEFDYEGRPSQLIFAAGNYKLQVWGAEGGSSTGNGGQPQRAHGGLGGYSEGVISFNEQTKLYIFVGGKGKSADSSDGSETSGGFPDGGGTKTGHYDKYTTVPGTGGGSTSVRIASDSLYARVIVAGGGGGSSGSFYNINHGGFGGGENGGNCYYSSRLQSQGSGTQTGSTPHPGNSVPGVAGTFGHGANGRYKQGCDSGGGGGGGWYGGSGGGHGNSQDCPGGGGGSGWIFTSASHHAWISGDSSNSNQFLLNESHYLTNASTIAGDSSFPSTSGQGNETGHRGNGYAIITPQ